MEDFEARLGGEDIHPPTSIRKVALASFIGSTVEWYDFFIYGTATALVFGQLFFPSEGARTTRALWGRGPAGRPLRDGQRRRLGYGARVRDVRGPDRQRASLRPPARYRADPLLARVESRGGGPHRRTLGRRWNPARRAPLPTLRRQARTAALAGPRTAVLRAAVRRAAGAAQRTAAPP